MKLEDIKVGEIYLARWVEGGEKVEQLVRVYAIIDHKVRPVRAVRLHPDGSDAWGYPFAPEEVYPLGGVPMAHVR